MNIHKYDSKKTIFCVSGMFVGGWMWDQTRVNIHSKTQYVMELPLCGISGRIHALKDQILGELKKINEPVVLISNSLGSYICLEVARLLPEKVEAVIISGCAGFEKVVLSDELTMDPNNPEKVAMEVAKLICFSDSKITEPELIKTEETFKNYFKNISRLMVGSNKISAADALKDIHCPVHAIWGKNDRVTRFSSALEAFERYGVTYDQIDECGHAPMYEKPIEFALLINNYLAHLDQNYALQSVA